MDKFVQQQFCLLERYLYSLWPYTLIIELQNNLIHALIIFIYVNDEHKFTILATIAIEIITRGFSWYLNSGWSTFPTLYGPLAALIGLLFWVFLIY